MNKLNRNNVELVDEYYFNSPVKLNDNDIRKINTYFEHYKNNNVKKISFIIRENFNVECYIIDICFCFSKKNLEKLGVENINDENEVCDYTVDLRGEIYDEIEESLYDILDLANRELEEIQKYSIF
ncbi:hypothetical protein [uncultured Clostridium sp.]|uniref:hypothetical protein n=1 Tax=uncultured Clostridium sp. TaxID=59620 RepID=UPI00263384A5|nr:hypothetical protein [uncultured Clostridium sp.]